MGNHKHWCPRCNEPHDPELHFDRCQFDSAGYRPADTRLGESDSAVLSATRAAVRERNRQPGT